MTGMVHDTKKQFSIFQMWVVSLAVSVLCCAIFSAMISYYVTEIKRSMRSIDDRLARMERNSIAANLLQQPIIAPIKVQPVAPPTPVEPPPAPSAPNAAEPISATPTQQPPAPEPVAPPAVAPPPAGTVPVPVPVPVPTPNPAVTPPGAGADALPNAAPLRAVEPPATPSVPDTAVTSAPQGQAAAPPVSDAANAGASITPPSVAPTGATKSPTASDTYGE